MTDFVRRLVSGNKARFKDGDLDLELDLAYITDQVIVMGYPATGMEGFYRNRREDSKRFLDHRHGSNYWVFNFCPVRENAYNASVFHGRVSRYPFPDHHAPPLAILALAAREMRLWLDGSPERVAVLHCKAGKGRSGTLACAYLLSLDTEPIPPRFERNYTKKELAKRKKTTVAPIPQQGGIASSSQGVAVSASEPKREEFEAESEARKEWAKNRAEGIMNEMPADEMPTTVAQDVGTDENELTPSTSTGSLPASSTGVESAQGYTPVNQQEVTQEAKLNGVATQDFAGERPHPVTTRDLNKAQVGSPIPKSTVPSHASASSKRANLAAILDLHTARRMRPESSSSSSSSTSSDEKESVSEKPADEPGPPPKRGRSGVSIPSQRRWLWYWSLMLADEGPEGFWPPLPFPPTSPDHEPEPSRSLVRILDVKIRMRQTSSMTKGAIKAANALLSRFGEKKAEKPCNLWVSLARYDDDLVQVLERWERWSRDQGIGGMGRRRIGGDEIPSSNLQGVSLPEEIRNLFRDDKWDAKKMVRNFNRLVVVEGKEAFEGKLVTETLASKSDVDGVTIDANREVRFKIYMGKVFMAWLWLIPAFHIPGPSATDAYDPITLTFTKANLDFPIGLGASLVDVKITLCRVRRDSDAQPPRTSSGQSMSQTQKLAGGMLSAMEGPATFRQSVEMRQGLGD